MNMPVRAADLAAALVSMTRSESAPPAQALVDKFQAMMQRPSMVPPGRAHSGGATVAAKLIEINDAEMQRTVAHMRTIADNERYMSLPELSAASIRVQCELMSLQLDTAAKMSLVHSSKSSIETLMKNQ